MKLEFFEKSMCCSSGVCGPSVDDILVRTQENIEYLKNKYKDLEVKRYQPQTHGIAFMTNREVQKLVKVEKMNALPITVVNGVIIKKAGYPTLEEIEKALRGV
ncbi:arsenite efflux transporter metallochaperone ArsD [Clostridium sp. CS001]|uniref:arsenite efflux transporter metallochaperone ArsD n=1 Tax=Clostridium sp. CS001 TaxID=2880648 RepID=UPI001CF526FF|nr:arsenite efflux transporter metallochaperone ArsD [Clostridium sp. CS001]MCB2290030.1 arsenite efflux transporter metallochaperone ArsD [Clostridium sp. CS001]